MTHPPRPVFHFAIGVTGHRPPVFDKPMAESVRPKLEGFFESLAGAARDVLAADAGFFADAAPILRLVTPLAQGADQLAAEVAMSRGFEVQAVLPMPLAEYRRDFAGPEAGERFDRLLERASCSLELPSLPEGRNAAYALAGRATLAHSDLLVAVWDGAPARGRGGTAEVVAAALRRGMPVIHVTPAEDGPPRILWSSYDLFVDTDEIGAAPSRELSRTALTELLTALLAPPADPRERGFIRRFFAEREWRMRPRAEYPLLLAAVGVKRLRRAAFRSGPYATSTREEWRAFRDACTDGSHGVKLRLNPIEIAYGWSDRLAQHFAQTYRSGHILNFLLGASAVLLALSGLLFAELKLWLAIAELAAIAGFVINTKVGVAREWHRRWLDYRQLAERLRPMRSLKLLGAAAPLPRRPRLGPSRWIEWYAASVWRESGCSHGRVDDKDVLTRLIVDEELQPQVAYHTAAAHQMHLLDHRLHRLGLGLFGMSLLSCLVFVVCYVTDYDWVRANAGTFIALSAGLPALGAAIFGIRVQGDFAATAERSAATAAALAAIVATLRTPDLEFPRTVDMVEGAAATMLADLSEWRLAYERRQLEFPA